MATTLAFPLVSKQFLREWKKLPDLVVKDILEMTRRPSIPVIVKEFQDDRINGPDIDDYFEQRHIGREESDEDKDGNQRLAYYIEDGHWAPGV